jgi:hypothetical protein
MLFFKHEPGLNSHNTYSHPFIFLLLFYDTYSTNLSIIVEIGAPGNAKAADQGIGKAIALKLIK